MPYIPQKRRNALCWDQELPTTIGELTYALTVVCVDYWDRSSRQDFALLAAISAALDHAHTEWMRRMVAPYEDTKRRENGDVYPPIKTPQKTTKELKINALEDVLKRVIASWSCGCNEGYRGYKCILCSATIALKEIQDGFA